MPQPLMARVTCGLPWRTSAGLSRCGWWESSPDCITGPDTPQQPGSTAERQCRLRAGDARLPLTQRQRGPRGSARRTGSSTQKVGATPAQFAGAGAGEQEHEVQLVDTHLHEVEEFGYFLNFVDNDRALRGERRDLLPEPTRSRAELHFQLRIEQVKVVWAAKRLEKRCLSGHPRTEEEGWGSQ